MTDFEMLPPEEPIWRPMKRAWVVEHPEKSYYLGEKAVVDDIRNAYLFTSKEQACVAAEKWREITGETWWISGVSFQ